MQITVYDTFQALEDLGPQIPDGLTVVYSS
jgi:hypothetical protein